MPGVLNPGASLVGGNLEFRIRTQTPGNYPKRNKLHLEHGESLKTRINET